MPPEIEELYPHKLANLELEDQQEKLATEKLAESKDEYRDPRKPALPFLIEEDSDYVLVSQDGSLRAHYNLVFDDYDTQRIRQGQCCLVCGESQMGHEGAMPEKCWLCGFPMREQQAERFALEFKGNVRVGPSTSFAEEMAIAEEVVEFEDRQRRGVLPSQIWVPRGL